MPGDTLTVFKPQEDQLHLDAPSELASNAGQLAVAYPLLTPGKGVVPLV